MFSEKMTLQILISLIILKKNILNLSNLRNTLSKHTHGEREDLSASAYSRFSEISYTEATRVYLFPRILQFPPYGIFLVHVMKFGECSYISLLFFSILIIFLFHFPSEAQTGMSFAFLSTVSQKAFKICPFFFHSLSWTAVLHHELCNT